MVAFNVRNVPGPVAAALRERANRHGRSLQQELLAILESAAAEPAPASDSLPPLQLTTVNRGGSSTWSREEIYGDDGR
ncbi:MAG: Arc family DNA-binding protein [Actinobacteria bacterium]|nr:Arc family DNA-binding protein [Actinomycetota bacterium]